VDRRSPPDYFPPRQFVPGREIVGGSVAGRARVVVPECSSGTVGRAAAVPAGAVGLAARVSCAAGGGVPAYLPDRRG